MSERRKSGEIMLERRREPRVPERLKATVTLGGETSATIAVGLHSRGVFLATRLRASPGTPLALSIDLEDGGDPIEVMGEVTRGTENDVDMPGMPVAFDGIESDDALRIQARLKHRA